jgi:hypothetical protein
MNGTSTQWSSQGSEIFTAINEPRQKPFSAEGGQPSIRVRLHGV